MGVCVCVCVCACVRAQPSVMSMWLCIHTPAEGVTVMTSTPAGRGISWLYSRWVVRCRRLALCRLEVQALLLWGSGERRGSKLKWEEFQAGPEAASFSRKLVASSVKDTQSEAGFFTEKLAYVV